MEFQQRFNKNDPLEKTTGEMQRKFVDRIGRMCDGVSTDTVKIASLNILLVAIRTEHNNQKQALDAFDYLMTKCREKLAEHYHPNGGRKNIFPFTQEVKVPRFKLNG